MFKREPNKNATTPVQKILTYGLIFFMAYVYFTESKNEARISNMTLKKVIKVTNKITGEVEEFPPETRKLNLSIKAGDIDELKKKPVGKDEDLISLYEIEFYTTNTKADEKPKNKVEKKLQEKTNLDAKPVSN